MNKMRSHIQAEGTIHTFTNIKHFKPEKKFNSQTIDEVFKFAYGMSFGKKGIHRNYRSGGSHLRRNGELFADTFQGKLAEYAIYNKFTSEGLDVPLPDNDMYSLGAWDSGDFEIGNRKLSIKSTKSYGQLLLLETKDWNKGGLYIPDIEKNGGKYDATILVRLRPFASDLLKTKRLLYSDQATETELYKIITNETYEYDFGGVVTIGDLKKAIDNGHYILKDSYINRIGNNNKLDASNYYVQTGDMKSVDSLIKHLKKEITI
ncbi:hypothetical protein [Alkalicoccus daliensis]|uniref:Restriction endonuclease n=1 Tax=Alkalicoccus daliensis TaxID=745820 RepID=A0A1H0E9B3_9BACI|nr:hypothetical protein [Alkalicoccus daliensis]SDN79014.1 hypothetical protein SAMN04488053_103254 [Alkalicoccus daliensis]